MEKAGPFQRGKGEEGHLLEGYTASQVGTGACEEAAEAGRAQSRMESDPYARGSCRFEGF